MRTKSAVALLAVVIVAVLGLSIMSAVSLSPSSETDGSFFAQLTDSPASGSYKSKWTGLFSLGQSAERVPMDPIMSKMGNETLKAELGRSSWRLIHTMVGKFPATPTDDEKESLLDFIYLFAKLYPCGDCARHFQKILRANPPDVSSRDAASQWACKVHNLVNKRLGKPQFDCSTVAEIWKCGCAEEDGANSTSTATSTSNSMSTSLPAASAHSTTLVL